MHDTKMIDKQAGEVCNTGWTEKTWFAPPAPQWFLKSTNYTLPAADAQGNLAYVEADSVCPPTSVQGAEIMGGGYQVGNPTLSINTPAPVSVLRNGPSGNENAWESCDS